MDVVRRNVRDLGGSVGVRSQSGKGSVFTIALPLTLAIIDGLVTAVGEERYIVPLISIVESLRLRPEMVRQIAGGGEVFHFRTEYLPLMRMNRAFGRNRSEERRVGKEGVRTCGSRGSPEHKTKK